MFSYALGKILPAIFTFLTLSMLSYKLEPSVYGRYSLTVALATGLSGILYNFIDLTAGRYLSKYCNEDREFFLSFLTTIMLLPACLSIVICYVLDYFTKGELSLGLVAVVALVIGWFNFNARVFNAEQKILRYSLLFLMKSGFFYFSLLIYLQYGKDYFVVVFLMLLSFFLPTLFLNKASSKRWGSYCQEYKRLVIDYGIPLIPMFFSLFFLTNIVKLGLYTLQGSKQLGLYSAISDILQYVIITICGIVHLYFYPKVIKARNENNEEHSKGILITALNILLFLLLFFGGGLYLFGSDLFDLVLGREYRELAKEISMIIFVGFSLQALKSYYFDYSFQIAEKTGYQFLVVLVSLFLATPVAIVLISSYSVYGAAITLVCVFFIYSLLSFLIGRKIFKLPFGEIKSYLELVAVFSFFILIMKIVLLFFAGLNSVFFIPVYTCLMLLYMFLRLGRYKFDLV